MGRLQRLSRGGTVWSGIALILLYWIVAPLIPNNPQSEWLRVGQIVGAAAVMFGFSTAMFSIFREGDDSTPVEQRYVLGTLLTENGIFWGASWLLLWRMAGMPGWMVQSDINGFWLWLICLGSYFKLRSIPRADTDPPDAGWSRVFVSLILTAGLGFLVIIVRPDAAGIAESLRVFLEGLQTALMAPFS